MWSGLLRVDWGNLHHAYGSASDAPAMLWHMVSEDPERQHKGWDYFWGSLHHQGDYYNSTVAIVPFLIEATANPAVGCRPDLLRALERLWTNTGGRGGYPLSPEPPGGVNVPTPLLSDEEFESARVLGIQEPPEEAPEPDEDAFRFSRPADLCAWQTGRAVLTGKPSILSLLDDTDPDVVRAAASLLGEWSDTRATARAALVRVVDNCADPAHKVRLILEYGKYNFEDPVPQLSHWFHEEQPLEVRVAAAVGWAAAISPATLPREAVTVLERASEPRSEVFPKMPEVGAYSKWGLPTNLSWLVLRLARSTDKELRWRMVQNFQHATDTVALLPNDEAVPVLIDCLTDKYGRIRNAAAKGLEARGPDVLDIHSSYFSTLIEALRPNLSARWGSTPGLDSDAEACGHIAHLLACSASRLNAKQRSAASKGIRAASERFRDRNGECVMVGSGGYEAHDYLRRQYDHLTAPKKKTLARLLTEIAAPMNEDRFRPMLDADRDLAALYEQSPQKFRSSLLIQLMKSTPASRGAVNWLRTLGPSAAFALNSLDTKATTTTPPAAAWEVEGAAKFVRWTKQFKPRPKLRPARLTPALTEQITALSSKDVYRRATAAESLAATGNALGLHNGAAVTELLKLLTDDASVEHGLNGRYEADGRLYHWRMERTTPRSAAILALFALGYRPSDERLFQAMVAEMGRAAVVCGEKVLPRHFPTELWRLAVNGAGGMSNCERTFSVMLRELDQRPYSDTVSEQYACADALRRVVELLERRRA